jgi:hypothetical protein
LRWLAALEKAVANAGEALAAHRALMHHDGDTILRRATSRNLDKTPNSLPMLPTRL